ncbi:hypothetical protein COLO4_26258 [Corchorus olitorius]|uniref:inositol-pentakisphosphate 2-kinase n=1 Tax=Corchorus olitorius TaxID=93759 RepID=A0A1R3HY16_9ROSI|nr:hypothetical protein COLO4_26258 [Corchorus olitorius]
MEKVVLQKKDAADWVYRGEGAANLVLAYTGSSPVFIGKVMRIQKSQRNGKNGVNGNGTLTTHERLLWRENKELLASPSREIVEQLYVTHVMSPLLGPEHVDAGMRVLVTKEFLESVAKNVICLRPAWRVDSSEIDANRDSVLIISDHSIFPNGTHKAGPCISVEIKPKCGFLPISRFIAEENAVKRTTSRFRLHQALKLHNHEISEFSKYNPLDLFSGSRDGIAKAIEALYATPQNNFRVFLNGSLVFGGLGGGTDNTTVRVGEAFEEALKSVVKADKGLRTTGFIQLVTDAVYSSGVLNQLLEVQKLDNYDIEGAIHAYYNIISQPCVICRELSKDKKTHSYASLHSIPLDESLKIVKDYLIAATAKDLSLMICFTPKEDGKLQSGSSVDTVSLRATNQVFKYKVYFIDLDLKPLKKMEDYYERDKKIVSCYSQMVKTEQGADKANRKDAYGNLSSSVTLDPVCLTVTCKYCGDELFVGERVNAFEVLQCYIFVKMPCMVSSGSPFTSGNLGTWNRGEKRENDRAQGFGETATLETNSTTHYDEVVLLLQCICQLLCLYVVFWSKTTLSVELLCPKCRRKVMRVISDVVGITSIVLDPSKNTVTVTGEADPVKIIKQVRKFRKHASIISIGAAKSDDKKDGGDKKDVMFYGTTGLASSAPPKICQRCDVWYVVGDDFYSYCSIL